MGKAVNWDAIPDTNVVPDGAYHVFIDSIEAVQTKSAKLMYKTRLEIMAPEDFAGMGVFDNFVIGSDDDPDGDNDATWVKSIGARRIKNMLKAAQVPMDSDMDNIVAAATQAQLVVSVVQTMDTEGDYKGQPRNKISSFFPLGHKEVGVTTENAPAPKAPLAAVPRAPAPSAKPAAAAPARPAPTRAAAPAPRPNLPTGVQLQPQAAAPAAKPVAKPALCTICNETVPRSEFAAHVEAHGNED